MSGRAAKPRRNLEGVILIPTDRRGAAAAAASLAASTLVYWSRHDNIPSLGDINTNRDIHTSGPVTKSLALHHRPGDDDQKQAKVRLQRG